MRKNKVILSAVNKTIIALCCIFAAVAAFAGCSAAGNETAAAGESIGKTAAAEIAVKDAGFETNQVTITGTELENEDGEFMYNVEFYADGMEYDYWLRASDGAVILKEADPADCAAIPSAAATETPDAAADAASSAAVDAVTGATEKQPETNAAEPENSITARQAYEIALEDAGAAANEATMTKNQLDMEDGVTVYDIEFYTSSMEYEYEINAVTGEVQKRSAEAFAAGNNPRGNIAAASEANISVEEAKSIAVEHAGMSASEVNFTKAYLDYDDGREEYEIEFYVGNKEYDYTIDALTGAVTEYDVDAYEHH